MTTPIRIGLVGIGRAGWDMHCAELQGREDKFTIVAACDLLPERRQKMAERYGCAAYASIEELIADPQVELVDIATRSRDHLAHALLALAAGKDVFQEKPMCVSYQQALQLQTAANASSGNLYIRHNRRFEPGFQHIREIMASGILGEVYEIKLRRVGYGRRDDWQTIKQYGGGQLLNWGPHIVDHALRFLESPVTDIWSDLKRIAAVGDAEDHLKIILKGENGRVVDLEISGGAALDEPEYLVSGTLGALQCTWETIHLKYLNPASLPGPKQANPATPGSEFGSPEVLDWIEETIPVKPALHVDMTTIWDRLYDTIRNGQPFPIKLDEAIEVMRVISATKENTPFA